MVKPSFRCQRLRRRLGGERGTVGAGRHAGHPAERAGEVTRSAKADDAPDRGDRDVGAGKHLLGVLDAPHHHEPVRWQARARFEEPR
jgi:hypothetical protein